MNENRFCPCCGFSGHLVEFGESDLCWDCEDARYADCEEQDWPCFEDVTFAENGDECPW